MRQIVFGGRRKKNECPIGLDVGASGVRLLQLALRGPQVLAKAAAFAPLPENLKPGSDEYHAALITAIRSAMGQGDFTSNRVVSALPASMVQCKNLRLPAMPADELDGAVQWEAADRFRMGEGQCSVQYMHAGQVNQGDEVRQELILLAAKLSQVEGHVSALTGTGLRPIAIDAVPTALGRFSTLCRAKLNSSPSDSAVDVLIDVGHHSTKVLIAVDGQVRFYKPIEIGGANLDSVLSGALSISLDNASDLRRELAPQPAQDVEGNAEVDAEQAAILKKVFEALEPTLGELAREIGLCLRYYGVTFRGARPTQAQLVGGGSSIWLATALGESTGLALKMDAAHDSLDWSAVRQVVRPGTENAWAIAAGLSIREHMKHFTRQTESTESGDDSVFNTDTQGRGVAA